MKEGGRRRRRAGEEEGRRENEHERKWTMVLYSIVWAWSGLSVIFLFIFHAVHAWSFSCFYSSVVCCEARVAHIRHERRALIVIFLLWTDGRTNRREAGGRASIILKRANSCYRSPIALIAIFLQAASGVQTATATYIEHVGVISSSLYISFWYMGLLEAIGDDASCSAPGRRREGES